MSRNKTTIKDIARELGLSNSTVSRALRDHPDISQATKDEVKSAASRLDYHPNVLAQSLKQRRSQTIGVILPEIRHEFFSSALNGIEEVAYKAGYVTVVSKSNEDYEREVVNTSALLSHRVAGLIVSIAQSTEDCGHFRRLQKQGVPVVFFDRVCKDVDASQVLGYDRQGAYEAVSHLLQKGRRRIAHLGGPLQLTLAQERLAGYREALTDHGLPFDETMISTGGMQEEDGIKGIKQLLEQESLPDAVFAVNDPVAVGAYMEIKAQGLRIPEDIALVGFSNNMITALLEPPLTTVEQPAYEMGQAAARLLLEEIERPVDSSLEYKTEYLPNRLIVRQSS